MNSLALWRTIFQVGIDFSLIKGMRECEFVFSPRIVLFSSILTLKTRFAEVLVFFNYYDNLICFHIKDLIMSTHITQVEIYLGKNLSFLPHFPLIIINIFQLSYFYVNTFQKTSSNNNKHKSIKKSRLSVVTIHIS